MSGWKCKYRIVLLLGLSLSLLAFVSEPLKRLELPVPKGWKKPVYDTRKNPLTENGFRLGRALFYDPILSADSTISCSSCHLQYSGFTHSDHAISHGIGGLQGRRNSPTLFNLAWMPSLMWDGGANNLEVQALAPLTSPVEMNGDLKKTLQKLNGNPRYRKMFYSAFRDSNISSRLLLKGLAQYTAMLISSNSRYDKVKRGEDGQNFTEAEHEGYVLFTQHCSSCHAEPLFTTNGFENNGLPMDTALRDSGRVKITHNPADSFRFKVPSLRNVFVSLPYMHDGRFRSLEQVIDHYSNSIAGDPAMSAKLKRSQPFSKKEKAMLISFLRTLTDKEFLLDTRFRYHAEDYQ